VAEPSDHILNSDFISFDDNPPLQDAAAAAAAATPSATTTPLPKPKVKARVCTVRPHAASPVSRDRAPPVGPSLSHR